MTYSELTCKKGLKMKERVLIHKESGELHLFTNTTTLLKVELSYWFLAYDVEYIDNWDDEDYQELGEL